MKLGRIATYIRKRIKFSSNTVVCILGMHRSGTSCLAGCLEERGLYLGDVVNYAPHNKRGNKENLQLRAINDGVLEMSGGSWDRPPEQVKWNDAQRRLRDEHIASYSSYKTWGFKDPRTVLTLPFWLEAVPEMRLVGTFRHPQLVARSLMKRPSLKPATPALNLWKIYNRKLLEHVDRYKFPLVCFDWSEDIFAHAVEEVAKYLSLQKKPDASFQFFDEQLKNNKLSEEVSINIEEEEALIYEELMKKSIDITNFSDSAGCSEIN